MKKNSKNKNKNDHIIKTCIIVSVGVVICLICLLLSLTTGEKYSANSSGSEQLDEDNILEEATKDAGKVSDDERSKPTSISIDEYLEAYQEDENVVVLFSRDTCEYCKLATPILENIIYESNLDLKYIDLGSLSDEDKNKLSSSNEYFKEGISTPLLLVIGRGEIVDKIEGLVTKNDYLTFFQEYGFVE